MQKSESALKTKLLDEQKLGFYTEFFVEAGRLDEPSPRFQFGNGDGFFDLASLTKALVTGPLVHRYLKATRLTPLNELIPAANAKGFSAEVLALTPNELLAHRSGLPAWRNFWMTHLHKGGLSKSQFLNPLIQDTFARINPLADKGDVYSDLGFILLGYTLEAVTGRSLDELWSEFLKSFSPSPERFGFSAQISAAKNQFIPTAFCAVRNRLVQGEVHDENCAALGGVAGHAGLFSQGPSVGSYLKALFHSSEGKAYFEENESERLKHSFEGLSGLRRGNGRSSELFSNGETIGHLGFVGTAFWIHWPTKRYAVFLTNRVISGRVNPHITSVRREVFGQLHELA